MRPQMPQFGILSPKLPDFDFEAQFVCANNFLGLVQQLEKASGNTIENI